jgi:hypothetical protein
MARSPIFYLRRGRQNSPVGLIRQPVKEGGIIKEEEIAIGFLDETSP